MWIKNFRQKWMIWHSSKFLVEKMLWEVDFSKDLQIAQLWVWDGVFTKEILKKMSENSKLYAFEIDKNTKKYISCIDDKRLIYIEDSAEFIKNYIDWELDLVISTLPFASLEKCVFSPIICNCKNKLKNSWIFLQYKYFFTHKTKIEKIFNKKAKLLFELKNFPPAFIYKIEK